MATLAKLAVELSLLDKMSGGLDKASKNLKSWGSNLTGKVTLPIAAGFAFMIDSASDLNETMTATESVFGSSAKDIKAWAKTADVQFGLSQESALQASTTFAGMGKTAGLAGSDLVDFSTDLVGTAADLSSFWNTPSGQVLDDLRSGLAGESEPLRKYNIFLTEADVAQRAMLMSGKANADQLTAGEKIAARAALIQEQLGDATGDFAKTSGGLANKLRILQARIKNLAAEFGEILLPYVLKLADKLGKLVTWFGKLSPRMKKLVLIGAALAAAIGPVLIMLGAMAAGLSVLLSPIGLIILAIVALGIAYKTNFLGFADAVNWVAEKLGGLASAFAAAFGSGVGVSELVKGFPEPLQAAARGFLLIADGIGDLYAAFKKGGLDALMKALPGELNQIKEGLSTLASEGFNALVNAIQSINWAAVWDVVSDVGLYLLNKLGDISLELAQWAYDQIVAVDWGAVWDGIKDVGLYLIDKYGDIYLAIGTWAYDQIVAVDWAAVWDGIVDVGLYLVEKLGDITESIFTWAQGEFTDVDWAGAAGDLTETLKAAGSDLLQGLRDGAEETWGLLKTWIGDRGLNAQLAIGGLIDTLLEHGKDLLQGLYDGAKETWARFKTWIGDRALNIQFAIGSLAETLYNKGLSLIQGLRNGALDKWEKIVEWLEGRGDAVKGAIGELGDILYSVGYDIVSGMADGLYAGAGMVVSAVEYLAGLIPGPIKTLLKMASPSKLMRSIMVNVPEGMALGMRDGVGVVRSAAESLAGAAIPSMSGVSAGMGGYAGSAGSSTSNYGGITINVSGAGDPNAVADRVFSRFVREMALTTGGV